MTDGGYTMIEARNLQLQVKVERLEKKLAAVKQRAVEAEETAHYTNGVAELAMKHRDEAEKLHHEYYNAWLAAATDRDRLRVQVAGLREVLEWLDKRGGLGHLAHDNIRKVLSKVVKR